MQPNGRTASIVGISGQDDEYPADHLLRKGVETHGMARHILPIVLLLIALASPLHAQAPPVDPSLPTVRPEALHQLSDNRIRQQIMQESQARYGGRCVCPYQTKDSKGHACKGRHEVIKTPPRPVCYPSQVTGAMVREWRQRHP
jgi:hypothetical protein